MVKDEYTLVLVKPDGVKTRHIGDIITRIERKGYNIEALKMIDPSEKSFVNIILIKLTNHSSLNC